MTLLETLMEKRAAMHDSLAGMFAPFSDTPQEKPVVRNSILRGNAGRDHVVRKGNQLENIERIEHVAKGKSRDSIRRLLGLFGKDDD